MRLLLLGAGGQVGWELSRSLAPLGEIVALDRQQCDLSQPERLPSLVRRLSPAVIVNAAAYTSVDQAEGEEPLAMAVNCTAAGVLAEEARKAGAFFVHYSTDYVFDGEKPAPYTEDDAPCPINAYGRSKLAGETAVRQVAGAYVILRTSWVYAARRRNFVRTILRLAGERDELRIVADQVGAPTWARDIAAATRAVVEIAIRERAEARFSSGVLHMTASGEASWYEFTGAIVEHAAACGLLSGAHRPRLHAVASEEYPAAAARPKNSRLAGERLRARFGVVLPHWQQSLPLCLREIGECQGIHLLPQYN